MSIHRSSVLIVKRGGEFGRHGQTVVHRGELLRHPVYTSILHWSVAILFILSLAFRLCDLLAVALSLADADIWRWSNDAFLHPWFGVAFDDSFLLSVSELVCADALDRS